MALAVTHPTLLDVTRRLDPGGKIDKIGEILAQTNEVLDDMVWIEGNLPTGHRTTVRTGIPAATWRKLNYGVPPVKSTTAQVTDACGMLENYSEVDKSLADLNGNTASFRLSEDTAVIEGMNQQMADTIFTGDTGEHPERFNGLSVRYNTLSGTISQNVISGGGSGSDNTSIWLVVWGPNTVHGIYPKGSSAGLNHRDLGEVTLLDAAGGRYQGYRTHYKWDCGLTVRDWRYVVRICNIDVSDVTGETAAAADIVKLMIRSTYRIPNLNLGRAAFYANRTICEFLHIQALDKAKNTITVDNVAGKPITSLLGIPIRKVDKIGSAEATVS